MNISFSFLPDYWPYFRDGVYYTLVLAFLTVVIAVLPAICLALMRLSNNKILRFISSAFIEIIRGTPMLVQVSIIYYGVFGAVKLPNYMLFGFMNFAMFLPCIIALAITSSAYVAEVIRAGILAVDRGQTEAARSLGMTQGQCMRMIVLPQAVKNILPALGNEFVTLVKESSICSTIGVSELMFGANLTRGATYQTMGPLLLAAGLYLCMTFPASKLLGYVERRMRRGDAR